MGMMRRTKRSGGFLLCLLLNMALNAEWSIPAWILLGLHFWLGISVWWFFAALVLWILVMILGMKIMGWAADCSAVPNKQPENKNPYSVRKGDGYRK